MKCRDCGDEVPPTQVRAAFTRGSCLFTARVLAFVCSCGTWFPREAMEFVDAQLRRMGAEDGPIQIETGRSGGEVAL